MTIWSPRLPESDEPLYRRIADALERDLGAGVLLPGGRLPAIRELADRLGVTAVTAARAYSEAAARGLIETSVGRGTFARRRGRRAPEPGDPEIDLATNSLPTAHFPDVAPARIAAALHESYDVGAGNERHRSAGAAFIGHSARPEQIVIATGTQQALDIAFSALLRPRDTLLTDLAIYGGVKAIAARQHFRLEAVAADRYGMLPDALELAARKSRARVVYLTPTFQNPTGVVMADKRRRELAAVAGKIGLTLVEDDVYGFLHPKAPAPIAIYAPDRTVFVTGVGKLLSPALRVGYAFAPAALVPKLTAALHASSLFASPIGAEIAATWIELGAHEAIARQKRELIAIRHRIANRILGPRATASDPLSPHLWLPLPARWSADAFADEVRGRGVRISSASAFAVAAEVPRAIRISLGAAVSSADLERALGVIASIDQQTAQETIV
jgi:DNA-binding transcriptional MocR family regulator